MKRRRFPLNQFKLVKIDVQRKSRWYFILDVSSKIFGIVSSVVAAAGIFLIFYQLQSSNKQIKILNDQNIIQEHAMMQQYRPRGMNIKEVMIYYSKEVPPDGLHPITFERIIINKGAGILIFAGALSCFSHEEIDLRNILLTASFDTTISYLPFLPNSPMRSYVIKDKYNESVNDSCKTRRIIFDSVREIGRMQPYLVDKDTLSFKLHAYPYSTKQHYIYSLVFYKDIDGNLYDTLSCIYRRYDNNKFVFEKPDVDGYNEYFGTYTRLEQETLAKNIFKIHQSIGLAIARNREQLIHNGN